MSVRCKTDESTGHCLLPISLSGSNSAAEDGIGLRGVENVRASIRSAHSSFVNNSFRLINTKSDPHKPLHRTQKTLRSSLCSFCHFGIFGQFSYETRNFVISTDCFWKKTKHIFYVYSVLCRYTFCMEQQEFPER